MGKASFKPLTLEEATARDDIYYEALEDMEHMEQIAGWQKIIDAINSARATYGRVTITDAADDGNAADAEDDDDDEYDYNYLVDDEDVSGDIYTELRYCGVIPYFNHDCNRA